MGKNRVAYWPAGACSRASLSIRHAEIAYLERVGWVKSKLVGSEHVFIRYKSSSMNIFLGSLEEGSMILKLRDEARE